MLSDSAICTVLRAVVLTQYWHVADGQTHGRTDRQTDGQTDGFAIARTALAMRALRRGRYEIRNGTPERFVIGQPAKATGCDWLLKIVPFCSGFHQF